MKVLWGIALLLFTSVATAQEHSSIYVQGDKDSVLKVVRSALAEQVSNANINPIKGYAGYTVAFYAFTTENTELAVQLVPVGKRLPDEQLTHQLRIFFKARWSLGGETMHINPLKAKIVKHAEAANLAVIPEKDTAGYKNYAKLSDECFTALANDPELKAISGKVMLSGGVPTLAYLANDEVVSNEEKQLVALWATKRDVCKNAEMILYEYQEAPDKKALYNTLVNSFSTLLLELYKGRMSYGEFAKQRGVLSNIADQKSAEIYKEELAANAREADLKQRAEAARAAINAQNSANTTSAGLSLMQGAQPKPQPNVNCTTRQVGNSLQTNCQ